MHLVEPRIVLEIACDQIQQSNRHASGFALRFPASNVSDGTERAAGWDRLERIVEIYQAARTSCVRCRSRPPLPSLRFLIDVRGTVFVIPCENEAEMRNLYDILTNAC